MQQTLTLIERAKQLDGSKHQYITEYAYQLMMQSNYKSAMAAFKQATKMEESNESSLHGLIKCQIVEGQYEEAEKTLEFLTEIQNTVGKDSELCYLSALLATRKYRDKDKAQKYLSESADLHYKSFQDVALGYHTSFFLIFHSLEFFSRFNVEFILDIVKEYLSIAPNDPIDPSISQVRVNLQMNLLRLRLLKQLSCLN